MDNLFELSVGVSYILKILFGEVDYKFSLWQHSYLSSPNDQAWCLTTMACERPFWQIGLDNCGMYHIEHNWSAYCEELCLSTLFLWARDFTPWSGQQLCCVPFIHLKIPLTESFPDYLYPLSLVYRWKLTRNVSKLKYWLRFQKVTIKVRLQWSPSLLFYLHPWLFLLWRSPCCSS